MKRNLSLLILMLCALTTQAQERRWHFEADLRYQHMMARQYTYRTDHAWTALPSGEPCSLHTKRKYRSNIFQSGFPQQYGGHTIALMETYRINPHLTAGLGLQLIRCSQEDFTGLGLMATLRYSPWMQHARNYLYTELGPGLANLGWGTSWRLGQRRRLDFKAGYSLVSSIADVDWGGGFTSDEYTDMRVKTSTHTYMHCLQAGVGIVF